MPRPECVDPIAFLRGLRATRRFAPDPAPDEALGDILDAARWAGSSMNRQPWHVIVVRDRATLDRLAAIGSHTHHLAGAPLGLFLVMDGDDPIDETYDDGRLSERIMLAARAHGLGSCIGWFWEEGAEPAAKAVLGVPPERTLRTAIAIGYPMRGDDAARSAAPAVRKPLAEIVSFEGSVARNRRAPSLPATRLTPRHSAPRHPEPVEGARPGLTGPRRSPSTRSG